MRVIHIVAERQNENCLLRLEGRFDSTNAEKAEAEIVRGRAKFPGGSLVIDMKKLAYISSMGLRVLLKLQKREKTKIRIINVSDDIFELLTITGFSEFMNIMKKIEEIDVSGYPIIGRGAFGTVYRINEEQIVKIYTPGFRFSDVELERNAARAAVIHQLPTAIPFKIVKCGECYGLVFELLNAKTLTDKMREKPEKTEFYIKRFVELVRKMHSVTLSDEEFPNAKEYCRKMIFSLENLYTKEEMEMFSRFLDTIPDSNGLIHGDLHTSNVMVDDNDELILIDMAGISFGHPIFDVVGMATVYAYLYRMDPGNIESYLGLPRQQIEQIWQLYLKELFPGMTEEDLRKAEEKAIAYTHLRAAVVSVFAPTFGEERIKQLAAFAVQSVRKVYDEMAGRDDWELWDRC